LFNGLDDGFDVAPSAEAKFASTLITKLNNSRRNELRGSMGGFSQWHEVVGNDIIETHLYLLEIHLRIARVFFFAPQ
jgi:hypothetical protein